eukprot:gene8978-16114_t
MIDKLALVFQVSFLLSSFLRTRPRGAGGPRGRPPPEPCLIHCDAPRHPRESPPARGLPPAPTRPGKPYLYFSSLAPSHTRVMPLSSSSSSSSLPPSQQYLYFNSLELRHTRAYLYFSSLALRHSGNTPPPSGEFALNDEQASYQASNRKKPGGEALALESSIAMHIYGLLLLALSLSVTQSCCDPPEPIRLGYTVVAEYPHDPKAFTQGIEFDRLCLYGQSTVRAVSVNDGKVLKSTSIPAQYFGEGLVRIGKKLYQLLWRTGKILIFDADTLTELPSANTGLSDGWGLATDGKLLIITDSSESLYFVDPDNWTIVKQMTIIDGKLPVKWLEYIDGELWGNIWQTDCICRINVTTGHITHWLLMHGLKDKVRQRANSPVDVLNGKLWPAIYEVIPEPIPPEMLSDFHIDKVRRMCHPPGRGRF